MKLDKIKFARLVHFIGVRLGRDYMNDEFVTDLDAMIDVNVPAQEKQYVSFELVDELLRQMAAGQKIPAIKAYRCLCNAGLKESKDAVEKYWPAQTNKEMLNDMLTVIDKTVIGNTTMLSNFDAEGLHMIKAFINTYVK